MMRPTARAVWIFASAVLVALLVVSVAPRAWVFPFDYAGLIAMAIASDALLAWPMRRAAVAVVTPDTVVHRRAGRDRRDHGRTVRPAHAAGTADGAGRRIGPGTACHRRPDAGASDQCGASPGRSAARPGGHRRDLAALARAVRSGAVHPPHPGRSDNRGAAEHQWRAQCRAAVLCPRIDPRHPHPPGARRGHRIRRLEGLRARPGHAADRLETFGASQQAGLQGIPRGTQPADRAGLRYRTPDAGTDRRHPAPGPCGECRSAAGVDRVARRRPCRTLRFRCRRAPLCGADARHAGAKPADAGYHRIRRTITRRRTSPWGWQS